jgi:hypothetical protein
VPVCALHRATENTTAIEGISPDDTSTTLVNALLGALGAKGGKIPKERSSPIADLTDGNNQLGSSRTTRRSTKVSRQRRRRSSSRASVNASAVQGASFQDLRSSQKLTDGLLTASDGSEFCVAGQDMIVEPGSNVLNSGKLTFASSERFDPACADEAVDKAKHCQGGTSRAPSMFTDIGTTTAATTAAATAGVVIAPGQGFMDAGQVINASALACTLGFQKVGGLQGGWRQRQQRFGAVCKPIPLQRLSSRDESMQYSPSMVALVRAALMTETVVVCNTLCSSLR